MSLKVTAVPTDKHGETNCVYVNPHSNIVSPYLRINNYVFRVIVDETIPFGAICLNFVQRKMTCLKVQDTISIADCFKDLPNKNIIFLKIKLEISHFSAKKRSLVDYIDYVEISDFFNNHFNNHFFTVNQEILVVFGSEKYIVTVCGGSEYMNIEEKITLSDAFFALYKRETEIFLEPSKSSQIRLGNVPLDMNQKPVVKDFNLEKLGIGGLSAEFAEVFRRAFASRIVPKSIIKKLGIKHVKGVLLHGPPGTGKTLIARKIGEILNCAPPKIVNGPEVFTKWVGGAEENIRKLFIDAETEQEEKGELSQLHLIIFDKFDAICKSRGSTGDNTGVQDNVVNQLLSKIDGVNSLNNVLLIAMTNRKDRIDGAVLRPGRFEVHIEIGLPNENGRKEILRIHTKGMRDTNVLSDDINFDDLAHNTKNFSGAELEGLVRAAQSHAFSRHIDFDNPTQVKDPESIHLNANDFDFALRDVKPAFGRETNECISVQRHGIIDYGPTWQKQRSEIIEILSQFKQSQLSCTQLLIHGQPGSGKSSLASFIALQSEFPYVKFISAKSLVGSSELQKCNSIRNAFEDSYKSPLSVIILDDIERLIEWSQEGSRYSNSLLQTLIVLIKAPPPEGKKLLVIGTTNIPSILETLEITSCFLTEIETPLLDAETLPLVTRGLNSAWHSQREEELAKQILPETGMPISKLIFMLEMSAAKNTENKKIITFERFSSAMLKQHGRY